MWESDSIPYVPETSKRIELIFDTMFANFSFYCSFRGVSRLLTEKVAGGNVVKLSNKWYLSAVEVKKMFDLFMYLAMRFASVALRMIFYPKG